MGEDAVYYPVNELHTLEGAIAFAARAHCGQHDKAGAIYILHPLRVMLRMETEEERIAAVLHDVLEDTDYTTADLLQLGCSPAVVEVLDYLTRRDGESYTAFIERARTHPIASKVKRADLEDNMDFRRLAELTDNDLARLRKYYDAWKCLV